MNTTRRRTWLVLLLITLPWLMDCGVNGSGVPVPPPAADFAVGATIPGWVLTTPRSGHADIDAASAHANGRWSVIFSRPLRTRPREVRFSMALMNNATAHAGKQLIRLTTDQTVLPDSETVVAPRVSNGHVVPDGILSPGEWDPTGFSFLINDSQDEFPTGKWPTTVPIAVSTAAAYDDEYMYFVFQWIDGNFTRSDIGPQLQWNGTSWQRRPHQGNDLNGNGVLDPGETTTFTATAEDEDRIALFFPIHDSAGAFRSGQTGCAQSCHTNTNLAASGAEAVHSWTQPDDLSDVWVWRAARTAPAHHADDLTLGLGLAGAGLSGGGSGFQPDEGTPCFVDNPLAPAFMFATSQTAQAPLIDGAITFDALAEPGYPALPPIASNAVPYAQGNFNNTALPPTTWTGLPPFFGNDHLPAFVQQQPAGSRADIETGSSYNPVTGQWTVEMRRRRTTRDPLGAVRTDDVQFEEDARFLQEAFAVTTAANGLPFSVSITDGASGHGVRETLYPGPLLLARDESLTGTSPSHVVLHDYGAGFAPQTAADFTDARDTAPAPTAGTDVGLRLKAGTDGGNTLFLLASWNDATVDAARDQWTYDGFFWRQAGGEDECRILWNGSIPRATFVANSGCNYLCHSAGGPLEAPAAPHFSTAAVNEFADLWRWSAGRTAPIAKANDQMVDWRFFQMPVGGAPNTAAHDDGGRGLFLPNSDPSRAYPLFMAPTDPNANATVLINGVPPAPDAVSFLDVLHRLPPPPPGGAGTGVSFSQDILPVFQANCGGCHPPTAALDPLSYAGVLAGGQSGLVVIPGNPAGSLILKRLRGDIQPQMPLFGPYLTAAQVQAVSDWIAAGAPNN